MENANNMIYTKNLEEQLFKTQDENKKLCNENAQMKIAFLELLNALLNTMKEYGMPVYDADDMEYVIESVNYVVSLDKVVYESEEVGIDEYK